MFRQSQTKLAGRHDPVLCPAASPGSGSFPGGGCFPTGSQEQSLPPPPNSTLDPQLLGCSGQGRWGACPTALGCGGSINMQMASTSTLFPVRAWKVTLPPSAGHDGGLRGQPASHAPCRQHAAVRAQPTDFIPVLPEITMWPQTSRVWL